ncbi:MAG: trypsin-like peptidase domain-containing protein [Candidatus Aenigmarchaeota archaeon]|nr:trypsin-like peptidase domain-containing protein [Candidatus Aenigmarchaeota archaeon]
MRRWLRGITWAGIIAETGLFLTLSLSLFAPTAPVETYNFYASDDGKRCEYRKDKREQRIRSDVKYDISDDRIVRIYDSANPAKFAVGYTLADGFVLTANHVPDGMVSPHVSDGRNTYQADVIGKDPDRDIAVMKYTPENRRFNSTAIPTLSIASLQSFNGDVTIKTLSPDGASSYSRMTLSHKLSRVSFVGDGYVRRAYPVSENDIARRGMSGSPAFDEENNLIGVLWGVRSGDVHKPSSNEPQITPPNDLGFSLLINSSDIVQTLQGVCTETP